MIYMYLYVGLFRTNIPLHSLPCRIIKHHQISLFLLVVCRYAPCFFLNKIQLNRQHVHIFIYFPGMFFFQTNLMFGELLCALFVAHVEASLRRFGVEWEKRGQKKDNPWLGMVTIPPIKMVWILVVGCCKSMVVGINIPVALEAAECRTSIVHLKE